ncbi:Phage lysozyme [compost metagenome]
MISGAYNFGVGGMCGSSAARLAKAGQYRQACEAQTAWNKAGGRVVNGLVNRREMGDAQRIGEAELCVSGLPT